METLDLTASPAEKVTSQTVIARHTPRATFTAHDSKGRCRQHRSQDCKGISAVDAPSTRLNPNPMARAMRPNRGVNREVVYAIPTADGGMLRLTAREIRRARKAQVSA